MRTTLGASVTELRALYNRYVKAVYRPSEISLTYTGRSKTMAGRYGPAPYAGRTALHARHRSQSLQSHHSSKITCCACLAACFGILLNGLASKAVQAAFAWS